MSKIIASLVAASALLCCGGCITHIHQCSCQQPCKCCAIHTPDNNVDVGDPIVSPDKINNAHQDAAAPQYPNITPWYLPVETPQN